MPENVINLPANHRRSLSVTARMVEQTLCEMENLLQSLCANKQTSNITLAYSDATRTGLLSAIAAMRAANHEMFTKLNLDTSRLREDRIVEAKLTSLWTILLDSRSKALKGFGLLSPEQAKAVDESVDALLKCLERFPK